MSEGLSAITKRIEMLLTLEPELRNDDNALMLRLWDKYYGVKEPYRRAHFYLCPNFQTVTRIRRKFNEQGMFLPTDPEVLKARGKEIEKWKSFARRKVNANSRNH